MTKEEKMEKKAYKKAMKKVIRPWRGLRNLTGTLAVICMIVAMLVSKFDNTFSIFIGGSFYELNNPDENAQYFTSDFKSREEKKDYEAWLVEQVEAEGAALLLNENNALPLKSGANVSCFSNSSVSLIYGGTGSGNVDISKSSTLKSALTDAGLNVNETLWNFYTEGEGSEYERDPGQLFPHRNATAVDVPWDVYTDEVKYSVKQYGDAALVVFSRVGGEGSDLEFTEENYLELIPAERELLAGLTEMKAAGDIEKIIVLLNTSNALQVDFLKDSAYDIDACLWIGDVGQTGIDAVADILAGNVTPSGRLVDTYCYDNFSSPAMVNFATTDYIGGEEAGLADHDAMKYVVYQEGIYVGYRYYETRYEDYVMGTGNAGDYIYSDEVAFTFGYGLSYTDFEYSDMAVVYNSETDQFEVTVTVTNVGDTYSGKEVVQVYVQSPYTEYDKENTVEKAAATLIGFDKTEILAPGESETVTVYVDKRDMASYDAYGAKTYILEAGDYYLTVADNAHAAINNILAAKGYTPETTDGRMDKAGNVDLTYLWTNETFDSTTYATAETGFEITNQFDNADLNVYEGSSTMITYLSRNDWTNTFPKEKVQLSLTEQMIADLNSYQYDASEYEDMEMPTFGAYNGLKLVDMIGLDYDDPMWDKLLDQMTYEEMAVFVGDAFHWTMPIESIQAPATRDENGPQGLTASLMHADIEAMAITSEDVMAATFNRELIEDVGRLVGTDCLDAGVSMLYGPGNNTHRTPYGGRNFEYYSEDGFLAGEISAAEVKGIHSKGVRVLMKHFALNDCEEDRTGLSTWANEQSIREIYLKAFQTPIEEVSESGVMTAYNRIGASWAGGHYGLLTNVMCGEWGCTGVIITDNANNDYMNAADGLMAGGTLFDAMMSMQMKELLEEHADDPVIVNRLREAMHQNLYVVANSCAMNGMGEDTTVKVVYPYPVIYTRNVAIVMSILFVGCFAMCWKKKQEFVKNNQKES